MKRKVYSLSDMVEQDIKSAPSLDLSGLAVEKWYLPKDNGKFMLILANVKKSWKEQQVCPIYHKRNAVINYGESVPREIKDIPRDNFCVEVAIQSPVLKCNDCNHKFRPPIDGIIEYKNMTSRLEKQIRTDSFLYPHTDLAEHQFICRKCRTHRSFAFKKSAKTR